MGVTSFIVDFPTPPSVQKGQDLCLKAPAEVCPGNCRIPSRRGPPRLVSEEVDAGGCGSLTYGGPGMREGIRTSLLIPDSGD